MSDLISTNNNYDEEIVLTQFETAQGWRVKIDLKTKNIWASSRDMATLAEVHRDTIRKGLEHGQLLYLFLRKYGISAETKQLKVNGSPMASCFDERQQKFIMKFYDSPMLETSMDFGYKTAILQGCGLLETSKPKQLTASEITRMMLPAYELAEQNPGLGELSQNKNKIPCLILHDKPFKLRYWVNLHHPSLDISKASLTRLGREIASVYRQHKLELPKNSYTQSTNQYNKFDHGLICQVFNTMLEAGTL